MRKYLYAVAVASAALVLATPAAQAHTATPRSATHVLTIGKLRGKAVKPGAVLKASLAKGTAVTISITASSGTEKVTCKKASFALKVRTNPVAKGKAKLTATSEKLSRCTINVSGVTVDSIAALNLPYNAVASDAKGDPVTVTGTSPAAPVEFTGMFSAGPINVTCNYSAAKSTGHASNRHHTVTFKNQHFTLAPGSNTLFCATGPASFNATFGPVRDVSVANRPIVFVN